MRSLHCSRLSRRATLISGLVAFFSLTAIAVQPPLASAQDEPVEGVVEETLFESRPAAPAANIAFSGVATSANARWLVDLYGDVLLREADEGGLDHWLSLVTAGGDRSRIAVARSFLNSEEGSRGEAVRAYADILRREPDPAGLVYWTDFLRENPVNILRFLHYSSEEYYLVGGATSTSFVTNIYRDVLLREPDDAGLAYHIDLLENGVPRWSIVDGIYRSPESLTNRVNSYFEEILERQPDSAELAAGVNLIRTDEERAVRAWLLSSDEAFEVFVANAIAG